MKKRNYTFYIIMNFLGCGIPIYLLLCVKQMHFVEQEYLHFLQLAIHLLLHTHSLLLIVNRYRSIIISFFSPNH